MDLYTIKRSDVHLWAISRDFFKPTTPKGGGLGSGNSK